MSLYSVDWDAGGRAQTVRITTPDGVFEADLDGWLRNGLWVTVPIDAQAGDDVVVTVTATGSWNAVVSGLFLGDALPAPAELAEPIQTVGDNGPLICGYLGGNAYFAEPVYVASVDQLLDGCYRYETCLSDLPSVAAWVQRLGCQHQDGLLEVLDAVGSPFEVVVVAGQAVASLSPAATRPPPTATITPDVPPPAFRPPPPPAPYGLVLVGAAAVTGTAYIAHEYIIGDLSDQELVGAAALLSVLLSELNPTTQAEINGIATQVQHACQGTTAVNCLDVVIYVPSSRTSWNGPGSSGLMIETANHIADALAARPDWMFQTYSRRGAAATAAGFTRSWYGRGEFRPNVCDATAGQQVCDEFPFWTTESAVNLSGVRASLRLAPVSESLPQAWDTSAFYRRCLDNYSTGNRFLVFAAPASYRALALPSLGFDWTNGVLTECLLRPGSEPLPDPTEGEDG